MHAARRLSPPATQSCRAGGVRVGSGDATTLVGEETLADGLA
jgi:hypothetical protein